MNLDGVFRALGGATPASTRYSRLCVTCRGLVPYEVEEFTAMKGFFPCAVCGSRDDVCKTSALSAEHARHVRAVQADAWNAAVRTVQELCRGSNATGEAAANALRHGLGAGNPYRTKEDAQHE